MILVAGATGQLGRLITQDLLDQGQPVRALIRPGSDSDWLSATAAETVEGDFKDPESLRRACAGVSAVITTVNSVSRGGADTVDTVDRQGNRDLIDAAAENGVRRFVFISALGATKDSPVPFMRAKAETEEHLHASSMAWTVLRPNAYMDFFIMGVVGGPALAGGPVTIIGDGRRKHSFIARADAAAYTVAVLPHPEAENEVLLLGGPEAISWRDAVAAFEQHLGRPIELRTVPVGQPVPGMPDDLVGVLSAFDTYDSPIDMGEMQTRYGVQPTSLQDFLAKALPHGVP